MLASPPMVRLLPHNPQWEQAFAIEAGQLAKAAAPRALRLHHIGSTAVPGLIAKPIIDILGEVAALTDADAITPHLQALGYQAMGEHGVPRRRYFRKSSRDSLRTHHLHIYEADCDNVIRHLAFRDYLRARSDEVETYAKGKRAAQLQSEAGATTYAEAKAATVAALEARALRWSEALHKSPH